MPFLSAILSTIFLALLQSGEPEAYDKDIILIFVLSAFTVVLPLFVGGLGIRKYDKGLRYFYLLLCVVLVSEATAYYLSRAPDGDNRIVYDIFTAVEYTLLTLMFRQWYKTDWVRKLLIGSIPVFLLGYGIAKMYIQDNGQLDGAFLTLESVVFVIISVVTLGKEMRDSTVLLIDNPRFWIASGILIYFAGNLFVFALIEQLLKPSVPRYHVAWMIHASLNVTKNFLFTLGFMSTGEPQQSLRVIRTIFRRKRQ